MYLNYAAMDPLLTNERCSFWHFRFYPSSEMKIEALTTYLKDRKDIKKVYLLNQDYTHGAGVQSGQGIPGPQTAGHRDCGRRLLPPLRRHVTLPPMSRRLPLPRPTP